MRKATYTDKKLVSDILVSAFSSLEGNNSINFVVKQDKKKLLRMKILMNYLFEKAIRFGEVYISEDNTACILLKFPHRERFTFKTIVLDIHLAFRCIGVERISGVLKRQRVANRNYPKEKHIRPLIMGIQKEAKGNGHSARLILQVKNKFKGSQLPVILDAASEQNVAMYQKLGFTIIQKEESLGFPIYFLRLN